MTFRRGLGWGYIAALHLLFAVVLLKTNAVDLLERRLGGYLPPEGGYDWQSAVTLQRRIDAQLPAGSLLFFGDSLVQGMHTGRFGAEAVNFGIGFETTAGLIRRLPLYRSVASASAVAFMSGSNDLLYRDADAAAPHHRQLLATLRGVPLVVAIGVPPVDEPAQSGKRRTNAGLKRINAALASACAAEANCRFADPWPSLSRPEGGLRGELHIGDGLHLNAEGYRELARVVAEALARRPR